MPIIIPTSGLLTQAGEGAARKLALASVEWFRLSGSVQSVLALPSDITEFTLRYGDASSGLQMKECFDAMHKLQSVVVKFGNPKQLRSQIVKDPNFLAGAVRPRNDVVSAIVWTLQHAHQDAFSLASTLAGIPKNAQGEPADEVVSGIKSLFLDTDQIVDRMSRTEQALAELITEVRSLQDQLDAAQLAMSTFTSRSSKTLTELNTEIGGLEASIKKLERDQNDAYDHWLDLTIAAAVVSAGIALLGVLISIVLTAPTFGGSLGVGLVVTSVLAAGAASALGTAAGIARTSYDNLVTEYKQQSELKKLRVAYRVDLGALDEAMKFTLPDTNAVANQIGFIKQGWTSAMQEIRSRVSDLTVSNLATSPWLNQAEMAASAANWSTIDQAMKAFMLGSFVDYQSLKLGDPLPKDDPDWQKQFQKAS